MSNSFLIRLALPEEASQLSELTYRSKQYWGYSAEFIEAVRGDLTVLPEYFATSLYYVLEQQSQIQGYYCLAPKDTKVVLLDSLFIEPAAIGKGFGKILWEHALTTALSVGYTKLILESEPKAEGFYLKLGAVKIGEVPSSAIGQFPGRMLPLLEYNLS